MGSMFKQGATKSKTRDPYRAEERSRADELSQLLFGQLGLTETLGGKGKQSSFTGAYTPTDLGLGADFGTLDYTGGAGASGGTDVGGRLLKMFGSGAEDLFGAGVSSLRDTIAGKYLDPTKVDAYQNLEGALRTGAQRDYGDLVGSLRSDAARSGAFNSSARLDSENRGAARVAEGVNTRLAEAGTDIYNRERAAQENAAQAGPSLVGNLGDTISGILTRQAGLKLDSDALRMKANLAARGIDAATIDQILSLLGTSKGVQTKENTTAGNVRQFIGDLNEGASKWGGG